jgi:alpha-glucosidase
VFPDFFKKKAGEWWGSRHKFLLDAGVDGIWNDMNEPSIFDATAQNMLHDTVQGLKKHEEVHNAYGEAMTEATAKGLRKLKPNKRHFLLTRAAYAGIQKYSSVWLGDNRSGFEYLAMSLTQCLGLGLSGVPFCGADVGGFAYPSTAELTTRWTQAGALTPFFRNHNCDGKSQEPWAFGEPYVSICRKVLKLRFRLLPYLYTVFEESHRTGAPVMRAMLYEFPQDHETVNLGDQFMLGSQILVAPVVKAGARAREVWLPEGVWTDFWTSERLKGGRYILANAPLDTLPIFLKAGAILPLWNDAPNTQARDRENLSLDLYPFVGKSVFNLYEDDGESYDFEKGKSARLNFQLEHNPSACEIRLLMDKPVGSYKVGYTKVDLRFHGLLGRPRAVLADGKSLSLVPVEGVTSVRGLMPGHFQARLQVPFGTREVLLQGVPGIAPAK